MTFKRALNLLILLSFIMSAFVCTPSSCAADIATQQRQIKEKINQTRWLESVENNKLYKNQQKLENATNDLSKYRSQIVSTEKELYGLQAQYDKASAEYNNLNSILSNRVRTIYKSQRKAFIEILLASEDINSLVDGLYYKKILVQEDESKMLAAKKKARELSLIKYSIESRKHNLDRSVASINSQQAYIKRAIARNESMIQKLKTDRATYQRAERDLAKQSETIGNYINKNTKNSEEHIASGFVKPIQGRITSPFGWRTHPIFNTKSFHSGVDIGGPNLGAIRASNSGKVIYTGWYGGYGKVVILDHGPNSSGKPITTLYAHMSSIKVANGARVQKGDVLGYEGTTGYSTGPHCHFEVRVNGQPNNPLNYI